MSPASHSEVLTRIQKHSPFLARLTVKHGDVVDAWQTGGLLAAREVADDVAATGFAAAWRRRRARLMLALALADLSGEAPLEPLVEALSDFADRALDAAIVEAITAHVHGAEPRGFAAIALGKHGSRELNYSSDIDPILIFDPDTLPHRTREEPGEAAVRIARRVVELLQTRDADGFVFRVDLRLRPASEATPIALPVDTAIAHYESSALAWERAAFIRARAAAGDVALGARLLDAVAPFVWRRSLDYGAVADLRGLTRAIRTHHKGQMVGPGYDVKRGRGGIREVEFFTQIHQLIHGGRNPALRIGATLPALVALTTAGWIDGGVAALFADTYRLLRTVEHRLQLVDDRQTHQLPEDVAGLDNVAQLDGLQNGAALIDRLAPVVAAVAKAYDNLDRDDESSPVVVASPASLPGFRDTASAQRRVDRWRGGGTRAIRSPAAVAAFEAMLPDLLAALASANDPDAALAHFDRLLGAMSSGVNFFRLLEARPQLYAMLVDILTHAPTLADSLARTPSLLDRLLDRSAYDAVGDIAALVDEMASLPSSSTEAALDQVRHHVGEHRFALGCQLVGGATDPLAVGRGYARLAQAAIEVVASRVVADFTTRHGRVPGSELVVVALGRMGGGLLTHASDLDLVYLFTGDFARESDGERPLGASHYYNRLAGRLGGALSAPTSAGALYDIDTRLRPSGAKGPLAVSLDSFTRYQTESAWTWERMALTRARPVFGSPAARAAVAQAINGVLRQSRDRTALAHDVLAMRGDIVRHKPPAGPLDVKLAPGGLVDLEFVVHFHQLASATGLDPDLKRAIEALSDAGLLDSRLVTAHDLLTRVLVMLRLVAPDLTIPTVSTRALVAEACGYAHWDALLAELAVAKHNIAAAMATIGEAR